MGKTIFEKLWDMHVVQSLGDDMYLLAIDRIYLHDLCGAFAFQQLEDRKYQVRRPETVIASPDHTPVSTTGRTGQECAESRSILPRLREGCKKHHIKLFDLKDRNQGIIHIIGPEQGWTLPGMTVLCGDSHTCTHGALGCLGMGVGTSEVTFALATSCLKVKKPKTMQIRFEGTCGDQIGPMDIMLTLLAKYGISCGSGYAVEYTGPVVENMSMDDRFTLCNLTIELGAEYAVISPDEKTLQYIQGRENAPKGEMFQKMADFCKSICSDTDCTYDKEIKIDITGLQRQVTWGINPGMAVPVDGILPYLSNAETDEEKKIYQKAYEYMGYGPGEMIRGKPIQRVFIGSCSNGRLSHIESVAKIVEGKHVAAGVVAWVVPGSEAIKQAAEEKGLDKIIRSAGFMWGEPGCSLCVGSNGEYIPAGQHCISTTNRNFIGRQGRGACTHLASPITAALSAIAGYIQ